MKLSHILFLFICLAIVEFFTRGVIQGQKELVGFALLNIFFLLFFLLKPGVKWCIEKRYLASHSVYQRMHRWQQLLLHYGATAITVWVVRLGIQFFLSGAWQVLVISVLVYCGVLRQLRHELLYHGFRRGKQIMGWVQRGLIGSILLSMALLGQYRDLGPEKYFRSFGIGLLMYSSILAGKRFSWKKITQHVPRILFVGVTLVIGLRVSAMSVMQRYDDHTIEKIVYEEKEKIIYLPAEGLEEIEEEHTIACDAGTCTWSGSCIPLPEHASCLDEDAENPWACDEGYGEEEGICLLNCEEGTCLWQDNCIDLPEHASCLDEGENPWSCDAGYQEEEGRCVLHCDEGSCPREDECLTLPVNAFCDTESDVGRVCDKRYYPVNGVCYPRANLTPPSEKTIVAPIKDLSSADGLNVLEKYQQKNHEDSGGGTMTVAERIASGQ